MDNSPAIQLLTCPQVAERLKISESFAYKLVQAGELPGIRIGRSIRVKLVDLERYIDAQSAPKPIFR